MKRTFAFAALIGALAAPVWAASSHGAAHDRAVLHADAVEVGYPGNPILIERTIRVSMLDASDQAMAFDPASLDIRTGETIRIVLNNEGSMPHEFVMATPEELAEHREEMRDFDGMPHEAPFAARLEPGRSRTLIWTFANEGTFAFAWLIPGYSEAGMYGRLTVQASFQDGNAQGPKRFSVRKSRLVG